MPTNEAPQKVSSVINQSSSDDWQSWKKLVLENLNDHKQQLSDINRELHRLNTRMSVLETKVVMYSTLGAVAATVAVNVLIRILPAMI